jgi:hypothetical protein
MKKDASQLQLGLALYVAQNVTLPPSINDAYRVTVEKETAKIIITEK